MLHHADVQQIESVWRGFKLLIDHAGLRQNLRIELLDISKEHLIQDFENAFDACQSGLYLQGA